MAKPKPRLKDHAEWKPMYLYAPHPRTPKGLERLKRIKNPKGFAKHLNNIAEQLVNESYLHNGKELFPSSPRAAQLRISEYVASIALTPEIDAETRCQMAAEAFCCLLHYCGFKLAEQNHDEFVAALLLALSEDMTDLEQTIKSFDLDDWDIIECNDYDLAFREVDRYIRTHGSLQNLFALVAT